MRESKEIAGSSALIVGYGREGKSTHRFLTEQFPDLLIGVADRRPVKLIAEASGNTPVFSGESYLQAAAEFDTIIRSPGIAPYVLQPFLSKTRGQRLTTLTNLFFSQIEEQAAGKVVGITGTKGKSTTSSLIHRILSRVYADVRLLGNIGHPALDFLEGAGKVTWFVVELSSFQLEDIHYSPGIAVLLEVFPEHLDHHQSFEAYVEAKRNILKLQKPGDISVIHRRSAAQLEAPAADRAVQYLFDDRGCSGVDCWIEADKVFFKNSDRRCFEVLPLGDVPLLGPGNRKNILAAAAVGCALNIEAEEISAAVQTFEPLPHRLENIGKFRQVTFINDSLSTIPESAIHALDSLGARVQTMIMGGHDRGISYHLLGPALLSSKVETLILFPDSGSKIWQAVCEAAGGRPRIEKYEVTSMEEAVQIAYQRTSPGRVCLMSPASSSLNMFRDYQERGELFRKWVEQQQ